MADLSEAAAEFAELARNLTAVGLDDLRRELGGAIDDAARPLAAEIGSTAHLDPYLPDRYAAVLAAGLRVTTSKRTTGTEAGVSILARAPTPGGGRAIRTINNGVLRHPVFADRTAPRRSWRWRDQDVERGFFTDPCERAAPRVREHILAAMERVADKATGKG